MTFFVRSKDDIGLQGTSTAHLVMSLLSQRGWRYKLRVRVMAKILETNHKHF